jgi:hypothetical protein
MRRKKTPEIVVDENGFRWNRDAFDLDSHDVQAPGKDALELVAEMGRKPQDVNEVVRERYVSYLKKKNKRQVKP